MFRFEKLDIWNLSLNYCSTLYQQIKTFPTHERFALSDQLRRAAISISTNIAEGSAASTPKDFARFLGYAINSTAETVSLISLAHRCGYIDKTNFIELYEEAEKIYRKTLRFRKLIK